MGTSPGPQVMGASDAKEDDRKVRSLVFHDLSANPAATLRSLLETSRSSFTVKALLEGCVQGIRTECASLCDHDRQKIPPFRTLYDMVRLSESIGTHSVVLDVVLTVTAQFGCFGLLAEQEPSLLCAGQHRLNFIGVCTGILVAAAAAASTSQAHLLLLSQMMIRIAFRVGVEADRRARTLDQTQESWTLALMDTSIAKVEEMLERFHNSSNIPHHRMAYISADLPGSVTISGPPSTLKFLRSFDSPVLEAKQKLLSISAPFHAGHLACPDVFRIVDFEDLENFQLRSNVTLTPSQAGLDPHEASLRTVLKSVITGFFQSRMVLGPSNAPGLAASWSKSSHITSIEPCGAKKSTKMWLGLDEKTRYDTAGADVLGNARNSSQEDDIAIIGMAGRFPNADTLEEFWDIIVSGKDVRQPVPQGRFDAQASYDKTASEKNTTSSTSGCFMKQPGAFDCSFFNLSPREAKQIDPQQRLLLMVTQEALQMAGYSGVGDQRVGTFFGQATDDWRESHLRQDIDIFYVGAGMRAFAPGRLNYHFKWEGPSYSVDTACSSSLAALELACKAVQSGDCDLAVAGGGNLCSALPMFSGLSKGRFTSPTGSCKTFCATADGYCRGECVGVVVIQLLKDAIRENKNVKGTVAGIVTNHSAKATSITHPHAGTQEALMLSTLDLARLQPSDIDYVEFHGTGTKAGDKAEITSVSRVFDEEGARSSSLHIGAVKANIGHCEAAAGIASLIKGLLMLQHNAIPPHCGIKDHLSRDVEEAMSEDLSIPDQQLDLIPKGGLNNILINNFNATGGNTCMVLRGPSQLSSLQQSDPRSHFPITVSAQTPKSLEFNLARLRDYLKETPHIRVKDISYSCTAGRIHYKYRKAFGVTTLADITSAVEQELADLEVKQNKSTPRIAFVFAGQGTQKQAIAAELFETSPSFKSILMQFESLCTNLGFSPFIQFLIDKDGQSDWTATQLQLATVAVELALARLWQSWGLEPSIVIGHSIGEYAALCLAGVISDTDMFALVGTRARLMEDLCQAGTHTMLSAQCSPDDILKLQSEAHFDNCEISCFNSPKAVTMSGPSSSLDRVKEHLSKQNTKSTFLKVKYAFHSANIDPILDNYQEYADSIPFCEPRIPVISTLLGKEVTESGVFGAKYLADQARRPVNFAEALQSYSSSLSQDDPQSTLWIEFGPGDPACLSFVRASVELQQRSEILPSLSTRESTWQTITNNISRCYEQGISIDWKSYHKDHEQALALLDMPNYAFDLQDFWIPLEKEGEDPAASKLKEKMDPLLHSLERYDAGADKAVAEFQSHLDDQFVFETISGHLVMERALCPSSLYSVMAIKAATFLETKVAPRDASDFAWNMGEMSIHKPLIAKQADSRLLRVTASKLADTASVAVSFTTQEENGNAIEEHGACSLVLEESSSWKSEWSKLHFLVTSRMDHIESSDSEDVMRLPKSVLYRLFSHVVAYSEPFQGIQSIILYNATNEAVAKVQFTSLSSADDDYDVHVVDSLMHFAGFVLNNGIDEDEYAYISDGWESLRILPGLRRTSQYKFYVRLAAEDEEEVYRGDIYALSESKIIAHCGGVRFRKMKKQSLRNILGIQGQHKSTITSSTPEGADSRQDAPKPASDTNSPENTEEQLKKILAQEAGVTKSHINDSSAISEFGLDSILIMSVLDKIKDQFAIEIPVQEASAAETFKDFKALLLSRGSSSAVQVDEDPDQATPKASATHLSEPQSQKSGHGEADLDSKIAATIAKHAGVSEESVQQAEDFSNLGVDSLLTLDIVDTVRKETGRELPASFLQENSNLSKVHHALGTKSTTSSPPDCVATSKVSSPASKASSPMTSGGTPPTGLSTPLTTESTPPTGGSTPITQGSTPPTETGTPLTQSSAHKVEGRPPMTESGTFHENSATGKPSHSHNNAEESGSTNVPKKRSPGSAKASKCNIRLMQGVAGSNEVPLFFLPPGDGTASAYTKLPRHPDEVPIFTPESPFATDPEHSENTFINTANAYKAIIRETFPSGPYQIAGYSVGGAYAFEVARLLLDEGSEVSSLVILDCPAPQPPLHKGSWFGLDAMTMVGYTDYLRKHLPTIPPFMLESTAAAAREFNRYEPKPFGEKRPSSTSVIWSTQGLQEKLIEKCVEEQRILNRTPKVGQEEVIEERRKGADTSWCFLDRTDFGPRGWDQWLGADVHYEQVEGSHVSIVSQPALEQTAVQLYRAMRRTVQA